MSQMDNTQRVRILSEALPYIQRFRNKVIVIKYGGSAMVNEDLRLGFARDVVLLKQVGMLPVVVHGGGPAISKALEHAGVEARFVGGQRVTSSAAMAVVERTMNAVNRRIIDEIGDCGGEAFGVTGGVIQASCLPPVYTDDGEAVVLGHVGRVAGVAPHLTEMVRHETRVPVIAPLGADADGVRYNINGDLVASGVASGLRAEKLILLTDTVGVLDGEGKLIRETGKAGVARMISDGVIHGGMLPKVQCAFESVQQGVQSAHIIDGRVERALLLELLSDEGIGTLIRRDGAG